jgi:hypothetical protein
VVPAIALLISAAILFGANQLQLTVGAWALVIGAALFAFTRWRSK